MQPDARQARTMDGTCGLQAFHLFVFFYFLLLSHGT